MLVAVAIGAVVAVQNRSGSDLATRPEPTEVAQQDTDEQLVHEEEEQASAPEPGTSRERTEDDNSATGESPEAATQPADTDAGSETAAPQSEGAMPTGGVAGEGQDALPSTGPMQTVLGNVIGLVAIIGAGYGYYHFGQRR